jgi:hypothetical protein
VKLLFWKLYYKLMPVPELIELRTGCRCQSCKYILDREIRTGERTT